VILPEISSGFTRNRKKTNACFLHAIIPIKYLFKFLVIGVDLLHKVFIEDEHEKIISWNYLAHD